MRNIVKSFNIGDQGELTIIHGCDFDVDRGEFVSVVGASGSGKSTMMHILAGLDAPTSGHVFVEDTDITTLKDTALTKLRRDRIGFVFQSFNLVPTLDARANILLPMRLAGKAPEKEWFDLIVNSLGIANRLSHRPSEMSGGQQQRVAIARALATNPELLLLDEITAALDPVLVGEVLDLVREIKAQGSTILMATHEISFARQAADRVVFLRGGQIVEQGPPEQVIDDPREQATRDFLARILH